MQHEHQCMLGVVLLSRREYLRFSPPCLGEEEIAAVVDTLRSGWLTTGPKTAQFEDSFAARIGAPAALAVSSCTAALHLALHALGIGPGDEVLTTTYTFAATVNVIEHVGAKPVLADVEPDTLNIDPSQVDRAITSRTRAIVPVHFGGHPCDMEALRSLAQRHRIPLVEDAAHAVGASYREAPIGGGGSIAAFSFYATKNLTTGEGGMLTGPPDLIAAARTASLHGMNRDAWKRYDKGGSWFYEVVEPGFKYNMTDIQASIGLVQLDKLPRFQERRRQIAVRYNSSLREMVRAGFLELPVERSDVRSAWHLYVIRLRLEALSIDRAQFLRELAERNIGTSVHFIPIHLHPYFRDRYGWRAGDFAVAENAYERAVSLPMHPGLADGDVDDVAAAIADVCREFAR